MKKALIDVLVVVVLALLQWPSFAAGPARVAVDGGSSWLQQVRDRVGFDTASYAINSHLQHRLQAWQQADAATITAFTGVKAPSLVAVQAWLQRMSMRVDKNRKNACRRLAQKALNQNNPCVPGEKPFAINSQLPVTVKRFVEDYLYEQIRLAALSERVSSEIALIDVTEINGWSLPDGEFLVTFDDGPSRNSNTEALIKTLNKHQIQGLFFVLGKRFASLNAEQRRRYHGHCVAYHGYTHAPHTGDNWRESLANMPLLRQPGLEVLPLFRPPYGQRTAALTNYLKRLNTQIMLWNIDTQDWKDSLTVEQVSNRLLTLMLLWRSGIILMHDVHAKAHQVVPALSEWRRVGAVSYQACRADI